MRQGSDVGSSNIRYEVMGAVGIKKISKTAKYLLSNEFDLLDLVFCLSLKVW